MTLLSNRRAVITALVAVVILLGFAATLLHARSASMVEYNTSVVERATLAMDCHGREDCSLRKGAERQAALRDDIADDMVPERLKPVRDALVVQYEAEREVSLAFAAVMEEGGQIPSGGPMPSTRSATAAQSRTAKEQDRAGGAWYRWFHAPTP